MEEEAHELPEAESYKNTAREIIYEKIAPTEALIISREGNYLTYAINLAGKVSFKKIRMEREYTK